MLKKLDWRLWLFKSVTYALALGLLGGLGYVGYRSYYRVADLTVDGTNGGGFLGGLVDGFNDVSYSVGSSFGDNVGMNLSFNGLAHIKGWEQFRAVPYYATNAEKLKGILTIGYGHVIKALENFTQVTEPEALQILAGDTLIAQNAVNDLVKVRMTQGQYDALVSLVFNIGVGRYASPALGIKATGFKSSEVLRYMNLGQYANAKASFMSWTKQNGVVLAGLVNRRQADMKIFDGGIAEK